MTKTIFLTTTACLALGCATAPPSEHLVDARAHYDKAANGAGAEYEPDLLYDASIAMEKAEQAYIRNPGSEKERHLSYIADRKALLVLAAANERVAERDLDEAEDTRARVLVAQRDTARGELASASDSLEDTRDDLGDTQSELAEERDAREATESQLRTALSSLSDVASIKSEREDIVITLSGEVLFKTDEATLLPLARNKLDRVANALRKQETSKTFVVEGHTDARGTDAYNEDLSQRRAQSVRSRLVSQGVSADRIRAVGRGESEPIASNKTPEGRANNRRVEIVLHDEPDHTASR